MEPMIKEDVDEDIDHRFWDVVDDMATVYKTYDQNERLVFLRRMRELANPVTTNLVEPSPRLQTRGRPKSDKKGFDASTKREPSLFEYQQSLVDSCSINEEVMVYNVSETLPSPMFEKKKQQPVILYQNTLMTYNANSFLLMHIT
ncbi:hypothetical protein ACS0TY_031051 [Phlomoides rotata]